MSDANKIEIANFVTPGRIVKVDRVKFLAMRDALLSVLPAKAPGITSSEVKERILHLLPQDLFPGGARAGWWQKAAQLDLEAKGRIAREDTKPLRFHLA
jgi:hypothetical protein